MEDIKPVFFKIAKMGGLGAFIFSFQFLHAFGLSVWLPVSLMIAIMMLLIHLTIGVPNKSHAQKTDFFLLGTLLSGIFPLFGFWKQSGIQNVLYCAAWLGVPLVYFLGGRIWLHASRVTLDQIGRAAFVSAVFLSIAIVIEFVIANSTGKYLSDFIPFSISRFPEAYVLEDMYLRPRGFTAEAGFSAVVFEALIPVSFFYLRNCEWKRYVFLAVIAPGYLLLSSAASMLCIFTALLVFYLISPGRKAYRLSGMACFVIGIVLVYLYVPQFQWILDQIVIRKIVEFNLPVDVMDSSNSPESFSRLEVYSLGLKLLSDFPFGIGWGMLSQMKASGVLLPGVNEVKGSGFISVPLEIFVSSGFIGGGMFTFFVVGKMRKVLQSTSEIKSYLFIALLSVSLHHVAILEFWFPMFWFLLALSDYIGGCEKLNPEPSFLVPAKTVKV